MWRLLNLLLGVPAAVLAAVSGGTGLAGDNGNVPSILALVAAGFGATLTTVNSSWRMTQSQASVNAYLEIQTSARQFLTIDLVSDSMTYEEAREALRNLTNTRDELNKIADPPSRYSTCSGWRANRRVSTPRAARCLPAVARLKPNCLATCRTVEPAR
ncbi:SLATT domain-containing protein [Umezawaea sp. NPDC059074]|uniref:SLATT domain-containing protein n=1 Tax=Umezawaea sp. NPDC059074 TaxID=3346716 RepID=UPI003698E7E6